MKKISLAVALSLSLLACGRQEKAENPFGRTKDPSRDGKEMTEKEFKDDCTRKKGYLRNENSLCYHVPHRFTLTEELKKELNERGSLNQNIGNVTQGAMLWGDAKGGQQVNFDLNGTPYTSMNNSPLGKTPLNAGKLTIRIEGGQYDFINAYVAECFTRAGSVPCPSN